MSRASKVYLEAARRIAESEEEYSCHAVRNADKLWLRTNYSFLTSPLERKYRKVMGFEQNTNVACFEQHESVACDGFLKAITDHVRKLPYANFVAYHSARRELRVLLLCMMAAAADDMEAEVK